MYFLSSGVKGLRRRLPRVCQASSQSRTVCSHVNYLWEFTLACWFDRLSDWPSFCRWCNQFRSMLCLNFFAFEGLIIKQINRRTFPCTSTPVLSIRALFVVWSVCFESLPTIWIFALLNTSPPRISDTYELPHFYIYFDVLFWLVYRLLVLLVEAQTVRPAFKFKDNVFRKKTTTTMSNSSRPFGLASLAKKKENFCREQSVRTCIRTRKKIEEIDYKTGQSESMNAKEVCQFCHPPVGVLCAQDKFTWRTVVMWSGLGAGHVT